MKSSLLTIFPYQSTSTGNKFPLVPVQIKFKHQYFTTTALVDSGASLSVFRVDVAQYIGIKIEKGKELTLGGIGGRIKGYIHTLELGLAGKNYPCPVFPEFSKIGIR